MSNGSSYQAFLLRSANTAVYQLDVENSILNPQYHHLKKWVNTYVGAATAEFHQLSSNTSKKIPAIRDENRNAILPSYTVTLNGIDYFLGIKGCGAYEDMFSGEEITPEILKAACRNNGFIDKLSSLTTGSGFIMGENWMGESPFGAQGYENACDELNISKLADKESIQGAYICPVIAIVKLPAQIESASKQFFWCRQYHGDYYQVLRLMPSNVRLYFESSFTISDHNTLQTCFGVDSAKKIEEFELNFIKSGIALLSLYTRTSTAERNTVTGLTYQDVWFDKDCVVAPNGVIYFADLEGLTRKTEHLKDYSKRQIAEWQKLVFEFLFALIKVDSYRHYLNGLITINWQKQREELALFIEMALCNDSMVYAKLIDGDLKITIQKNGLPTIEIPLIEKVNA